MSEQLVINGYRLEKPLTTNNSGFARWGFATKDGRRYFIKEFLSPVWPGDDSGLSENMLRSRRAVCEAFEKEKIAFYDRLSQCRTGNIVTVDTFFRAGPRYYVVSESIRSASDAVTAVSRAPETRKRTIFRLLAYNLSVLHEHGIIHADLKPSNILIKQTLPGCITAKIIDFDSSFLRDAPPDSSDDVHGDFVYLAPEVFFRMRDEEGELTEKLDIFSLGVLFHVFWCGRVPSFADSHHYLFEAVASRESVTLDESLPPDLRALIERMISLDPADRPSAKECCIALRGEDRDPSPAPTVRWAGEAIRSEKAAPPAEPVFWKKAGDL